MRKTAVLLLSVIMIAAVSGMVSAEVLFSSDLTTSTGFVVNGTADTLATFDFEYAAVGIPQNSGSDTRALKLEANRFSGTSNEITVVTDQNFDGWYRVEFDMWLNYVGPLELGGAGSTEFGGGVVGNDGVSAGRPSGAITSFSGDAGSSTDLRAYENGTQQTLGDGGFNPLLFGLNHPDIAALGLFPSVAAPAAQLGLFPSQTEMTQAGAAGFDWRHWDIVVNEAAGTAEFTVDGVHVVTLDAADGTGFNPVGAAGFLYMDIFSSVAGDINLAFGLFDNFEVSRVPEPATCGLGLVSLLGLLMLRRRT